MSLKLCKAVFHFCLYRLSGALQLISCFIHSDFLPTDKSEKTHNAHIWQTAIVEGDTTGEL